MKIISHRGYWKDKNEKNTEQAFTRSFSLNYGTETDVRDYLGDLVISHDIADANAITLNSFLEAANKYGSEENKLTLALNIKADGLASNVALAINKFKNLDCFVFDMAVPDMRSYFDHSVPVFTRCSEVESQPVWIEKSAGIWLDAFDEEWFTSELILTLLATGKRVCIVSSELHGRDNTKLWEMLLPLNSQSNLILCTDIPEEASEYFSR